MKAIILAGGVGSRVASLTNGCPKPLLEVAGKPFIQHLLDKLLKVKIFSEIVISVNYRSQMFVNLFKDGDYEIPIKIVEDRLQSNSLSNILLDLLEVVGEHNFLVLNADTVYRCNIAEYIRLFNDSSFVCGRSFMVDHPLSKRLGGESVLHGWLNAGLNLFSPAFSSHHSWSRSELTIDQAISGMKCFEDKFDLTDFMFDLGHPENLLQTCLLEDLVVNEFSFVS